MSEAKFVVGQWVVSESRAGVFRVAELHHGGTLKVDVAGGGWSPQEIWRPFLWEVGKTYKTTLDTFAAMVARVEGDQVHVVVPWKRGEIVARVYRATTGKLRGWENSDDVPHLLPYLADEPPPVADAATYSEFADSDECDKERTALESMLDEFVAERMACEVELRTSRDLVSRWESRIDAWQHAEKIAREKIERAKR